MKKVLCINRKEGQLPEPYRSHQKEAVRPIFCVNNQEKAFKDEVAIMKKLRIKKGVKRFKTEGNEIYREFDRIHQHSKSPQNEDKTCREEFQGYKKQEQIINRSISVYSHLQAEESAFFVNHNNLLFRTNQPFACTSLLKKQTCAVPQNPLDLVTIKQQIVTKIKQRLDLLKRQKLGSEHSGNSTLKLLGHLSRESPLGKDRLYDYCLKNINKCIQVHQKDTSKSLNKRYFQLKREGEDLSKELEIMRRTVWQQSSASESIVFGVIGRGKQLSEDRKKQKLAKKNVINRPLLTCSSLSRPEAFRNSAIAGWQQQLEED